jgi:tyrosine decarboxylase
MQPPKEKQLATENHPLAAWFLGPKGEHSQTWADLFSYIFEDYVYWRRNYFPQDPIVVDRMRRRKHEPWFDYMTSNLDNILKDLKAHFPFYSPRYVAHMLSEQSLPSVLGYFAGMLYNPNNVTDEAAPVTVRLELEVGNMLSAMIGYKPDESWAHICSGGTVANIEALWVARVVRFVPLIIQEFCKKEKVAFEVKTANGQVAKIDDLSPGDLLHLPPDRAIQMIKKLAQYLILDLGQVEKVVLPKINNHFHASAYNPAHKGLFAIYKKIGLLPHIYVSSSAHYSINKAANLLGYGEDSVFPVPVNAKFRMDSDYLKEALYNQPDDIYTVAVVAVMGTTEEGAIDPLHKIVGIRDNLEKEKNRSFWLHADAAWGGYVRSLFCGHEEKENSLSESLDEQVTENIRAINAKETFTLDLSNPKKIQQECHISWDNPEVYKAFIQLKYADSVTIDPHKMGYIPYPAGIIAFKNGLVTDFLAQKAQYISDIQDGIKNLDEHSHIEAIGPYILEGSKPGAAAASCWLSHKTIPLEIHGHGKIVRTTLLNAKKLACNLSGHKNFYDLIEDEIKVWDKKTTVVNPFTFFPLYDPDTNIVCFIATATAWIEGDMKKLDKPLKWINEFNERIYKHLTISGSDLGYKPPYAQPYFISRTRFDKGQYSYDSIKSVLAPFNISQKEYEEEGLFVLRSTVMNPFYYLAEHEGKNYLLDFVKYLHLVARGVINKMYVSK